MEKNRTVALFSLFGVTLLWGGTFIWMQQSLDAASNLIPTLSENHVAIFFVMMRFVIAGFFLLLLIIKVVCLYIFHSAKITASQRLRL